MTKFLDPVANAKTIGFILILFGFFDLLAALSEPTRILSGLFLIVSGFWLRKLKLWGVYAFGLAVLLDVSSFGYRYYQGARGGLLISVIFEAAVIAIFFWIFSARSKFVK